MMIIKLFKKNLSTYLIRRHQVQLPIVKHKTSDVRSTMKGSIKKKKPALSKTFYSRGYNSESIGRKALSKQIKPFKHRRVDSGGKHATEKVLEHISKYKRKLLVSYTAFLLFNFL